MATLQKVFRMWAKASSAVNVFSIRVVVSIDFDQVLRYIILVLFSGWFNDQMDTTRELLDQRLQ